MRVRGITAVGAAVGTATASMAAVVALTAAQTPPPIELAVTPAALVIQGSSTNQAGDGIEEFFGGQFDHDSPTYTNFLTGPAGIWSALQAQDEVHPGAANTVLSSGWGAANASLLISYLQATDPDNPLLTDTTWVLDNNVANPNGGFGTRYPLFALIGVNPVPTPSAEDGPVVISTAYEYDINGNAPKYILNPVADLNSLAGYFDRRMTQADLMLPVTDTGEPDCTGAVSYDTADDGSVRFSYPADDGEIITGRITRVGNVTYVGYDKAELPLLAPLRQYGGESGRLLADAAEPALRAAVNWGYPDNDPLGNPGTVERVGLLPSVSETRTFAREFSEGLQAGANTLAGSARQQRSLLREQLRNDSEDVTRRPAPTGLSSGLSSRHAATHRQALETVSAKLPNRLAQVLTRADTSSGSADPQSEADSATHSETTAPSETQ